MLQPRSIADSGACPRAAESPKGAAETGRRLIALVPLAVLLLTSAAATSPAATGGPDAFGHRWRDHLSGCSIDIEPWGDDVQRVDAAPLDALQGPIPLGFNFPFYGELVREAWISPFGWITFSPGQPAAPTADVLPSVAGPNHLISPLWIGAAADIEVVNILWEATPGGMHVEWQQWSAAGVTVWTHLWLHDDGRVRVTWRNSRDIHEALVGYEDASGSRGETLLQRTAPGVIAVRDGDFPEPRDGFSFCLSAPPMPRLLDCGPAEAISCGVTAGASPATMVSNVEFHGCSVRRWAGREKVFTLEVPELVDLDLTLDALGRDMAVFLLQGCDEFSCLAGGGLSAGLPSLLPGSYQVVVDARDASQEGPFTLELACRPRSEPVACGATASGTTVGGLERFDAYAALPGDFSGPEAYYHVETALGGNVTATLSSPSELGVLIFEGGGPLDPARALGSGVGGAVLGDAAPGRYLIVVDGPPGAGANHDLAVACEPRIACGAATPLIGCHEMLAGSTVGGLGRADFYDCSRQGYSGPEAVFEFRNDRRRAVSFVLDDAADPRLDLLLLSECNEGACLAIGDAQINETLEPGTYYLVVDAREGAAAPFTLQVLCGNRLEPELVELPLAAGACFTEHKTAWLTPAVPKADILFAMDLTESMDDEQRQLLVNMQDIVARLAVLVDDLAYGLVSYKDYPWPGIANAPCPHLDFGQSGDYPYALELPLTTDPAAMQAALVELPDASGGGEMPEAYNRMLYEAATDPAVGWRPGSRRILVNFGDSLPHDCNVLDCLGGVASQTFGIDPGPDDLSDTGDELATLAVLQGLIDERITLLHLDSSAPDVLDGFSYREIWDCWARRTGGLAESLNSDGTVPSGIDLSELIQGLVRDQAATCDELRLVASPGYEDWLVSASPVHRGQELPAIVEFDIEVCVPAGTLAGIHEFEVQVSCDGGLSAAQVVRVDVREDCYPARGTPPDDRSTCAGDAVSLDASDLTLDLCAGVVEYEWREGGVVVGTAPVLDVAPTATTTFDLAVGCSTDPACLLEENVTVEVHAPPLFTVARARDVAECNLGVEVSWDAALFRDPGATGSYNVYRSEVSCDDALARPPLALGVSGLSWVDGGTDRGATYHYVVEAEDAQSPSPCRPNGPNNGGAVARACASAVEDRAEVLVPGAVGAVLRAAHDGQEIVLAWSAARAPLPDEHFHLRRADDDAGGTFRLVNPEGDLSRRHAETDASSPLQFFDLRVANACEQESVD